MKARRDVAAVSSLSSVAFGIGGVDITAASVKGLCDRSGESDDVDGEANAVITLVINRSMR